MLWHRGGAERIPLADDPPAVHSSSFPIAVWLRGRRGRGSCTSARAADASGACSRVAAELTKISGRDGGSEDGRGRALPALNGMNETDWEESRGRDRGPRIWPPSRPSCCGRSRRSPSPRRRWPTTTADAVPASSVVLAEVEYRAGPSPPAAAIPALREPRPGQGRAVRSDARGGGAHQQAQAEDDEEGTEAAHGRRLCRFWPRNALCHTRENRLSGLRPVGARPGPRSNPEGDSQAKNVMTGTGAERVARRRPAWACSLPRAPQRPAGHPHLVGTSGEVG